MKLTSMKLLMLAALVAGGLAAPGTASAQIWAELEREVERGIRARTFPGAVVVVGRRDTILHARGYGRVSWARGAVTPSPDSTLWDLASLTKVVATAGVAIRFVDRGVLDLDAPVARYLSSFSGGRRDQVTVRMLLDHTSGLRPWAPLFREHRTREEAIGGVLAEAPRVTPGVASLYSDLNAILLGLVLERVGGAPLHLLATTEVFVPLGLSDLMFEVPSGDRVRTAPSRLLADRTVVAGVVNDDNARRLGGAAGHAGLFGSGLALARFAQAWLAEGAPRGARWVGDSTIRRFLARSTPTGRRTLGWDTPDTTRPNTSYGALRTPTVVGHTGWTGTSLWLDPKADLFVVLLTNRSISPRGNRTLDDILEVRAAVSDAARRAMAAVCAAEQPLGC